MSEEKPPPPKAGPTPDYEERVHISRIPTSKIRLDDVAHEVKRQALHRLRRYVSFAFLGASGLAAGGGGLYRTQQHEKHEESLRDQVKALKEELEKLKRCCP